MNTFSKIDTCFYPIFHFSANNKKQINRAEKETFGHFLTTYLKSKTINARNLLKSYQPIHRLIIIRIIPFNFKT